MNAFLFESAAFLFSLFCVWLVRTLAYRYGWMAKPRKDRWHKKPVALYGGVGIFVPFIVVGLILLAPHRNTEVFKTFFSIFTGASCVFFLGLLDDIKNYKPATKLIGQTIAASLPISAGLILYITPWYLINVLMTYFWFIGVMNAVNMIDNMDGLSSGVVMISTLSIIAILISSYGFNSDNLSLHISVVFLCSVAGFWVFNKYPASIFMGDSGSLFIGYLLAAIAIPGKLNGFLGTSSSILVLFLPVIVVAIPIFDTTFVTVLRKLHGRPASLGGKDHSSHRLVGLGFSEKQAVLILYALAVAGGVIAISLRLWPAYSIPLVILYIIFLCLIGIYLGRVKVYPESVIKEKNILWTPLVSQIFYKRQAAEVILDIILIAVSYYVAYLLRFEGPLNEHSVRYMQSLPIIVASCMASFFVQGVYRGIWNLITVDDIGRYLKGSIIGSAIGILFIVAFYRFDGYSRTVFIIFNVLLFLFMVGARLFFRILDNITNKNKEYADSKINVLIYGAGQAGKLLFEESVRNPFYRDYNVVGFVDDDDNKCNRSIAGIKIFGKDFYTNNINFEIDELWISSSKIHKNNIDFLLNCLGNGTKVKNFKLLIE